MDLIVPLGSTFWMAAFCTWTVTLSAISIADVILAHLGHFSEYAAQSGDFIALLQRFHHGFLLFGALLLRTQDQEIEHGQQRHQRQKLH